MPDTKKPSEAGAPSNDWAKHHWDAYKNGSSESRRKFYEGFVQAGYSLTELSKEAKVFSSVEFISRTLASLNLSDLMRELAYQGQAGDSSEKVSKDFKKCLSDKLLPTTSAAQDLSDFRREFAYQGLNLISIRHIFIALGSRAHGGDSRKIEADLSVLIARFVIRGTNISGAIGRAKEPLDSVRKTLKTLAQRYFIVSPKHRNNDRELLNGKPNSESITLGRLAAAFPLWTATIACEMQDNRGNPWFSFLNSPHSWYVFSGVAVANEISMAARVKQAKDLANEKNPFNENSTIEFCKLTKPISRAEFSLFLKRVKWPLVDANYEGPLFTFQGGNYLIDGPLNTDKKIEMACAKYRADNEWKDEPEDDVNVSFPALHSKNKAESQDEEQNKRLAEEEETRKENKKTARERLEKGTQKQEEKN